MKRKSLNNPEDVSELLKRIEKLSKNTKPLWGRMNSAQMLLHCSLILKTATGEVVLPKTIFFYRFIGIATKYTMWWIGNGIPPDMPTYKCLKCEYGCSFDVCKEELKKTIKSYAKALETKKLKDFHQLFGRMDDHYWGFLEYKHIHHHLKQFKV